MTEQEEKIFSVIRKMYTSYQDYFQEIDGKEIHINAVGGFERSFLHEAIANQKFDVASDLIKRGIDVNLQDDNKNTVLHYLVAKVNISFTPEILKAGGNPNIENKYGLTPLHNIVCTTRNNDDKYELIEMLLAAGGDLHHVRSTTGDSILDIVEENFFYDTRLMDIINKYT